MDKLKMHSLNKVEENVEKIGKLFPNCITERIVGYKDEMRDDGTREPIVEHCIDFDMLRQELSSSIVEGREERYQFTWPDKKKSILLANAPIAETLRPCREESVDFDNTENLYIEGDNLDVLKLLQETYLGKIKMIYIDPPYNTGKDCFVYDDDYSMSESEFTSKSGAYDSDGNLLYNVKANNEGNGRFHTDWLNMIYPRIKLSKDLLSEDGCVFISIDENEETNAKKICNEIFGEANCVGIISNTNNPKGRSDDKYVATAHEYILIYAKNIGCVEWHGFEPTEEIIKRYNKVDNDGKKYREIDLRKTGENDLREDRPNLFYYFYYNKETGAFYPSRDSETPDGFIQIKPQREDGKEGNWRWGIESATKQISELTPKFMPARKVWGIMQKDYFEGRALVKPTSSWTYKDVNSERGTEEFIALGFDKRVFPKPKPIGTIKRCVILNARKDDFILDFFSGSATTAHAVMQLNAEDGGHRKFIMVQLPEKTGEQSEAYKAGYKNICEIGKERIRRAGRKIKEESPLTTAKLDTGFRVLKLDSTNMKEVYYTPEEYDQTALDGMADNIKEDRTSEDLLFQVMLDLGVLLSSKIEESTIAGKKVFNVADGFLMACFDANVTEEVITEIAKNKPRYYVMRDYSMASDNVAANLEQIWKAYSPNTKRRVI